MKSLIKTLKTWELYALVSRWKGINSYCVLSSLSFVPNERMNRHFLNFFGDQLIWKCGVKCRDQGHYHCLCCKTVLRRPDMLRHLEVCQGSKTATPVPLDLSSSSVEQQTVTATPLSSQYLQDTPAAVFSSVMPAAEDNRSSLLSLKKKKCPHCKTEISTKNLGKHIQRKHNGKPKDIL